MQRPAAFIRFGAACLVWRGVFMVAYTAAFVCRALKVSNDAGYGCCYQRLSEDKKMGPLAKRPQKEGEMKRYLYKTRAVRCTLTLGLFFFPRCSSYL